ncbi:MAG: hypothetical protein R3B70_11945 [Polyangiaceae bacterium]
MIAMARIVGTLNWLQVLAAPHVYRTLGTAPTREILIRHIDTYLEYVRSGQCFTDATFPNPPLNEREARAIHARSLLEQWEPPDLTADLVTAVRSLLYAEGFDPPMGWDNLPQPSGPIAEGLDWS